MILKTISRKVFGLLEKRNKKITFIFGVPRSGTTWLWSMLESNKEVIPYLISSIKDENGQYAISETAVYKKHKRPKKMIQSFANKNYEYRIVEKTPYHTLYFDKIISDFPESKNILILRSPISIVNSMINSQMKAFEKHDIPKSCNEIIMYYKNIRNIVNNSNVYVITYEDLIENTEKELNKVFNYLKITTNDLQKIISENTGKTKVSVKGVWFIRKLS